MIRVDIGRNIEPFSKSGLGAETQATRCACKPPSMNPHGLGLTFQTTDFRVGSFSKEVCVNSTCLLNALRLRVPHIPMRM